MKTMTTRTKISFIYTCFIMLLAIAQTACTKLVDVPTPVDAISDKNVYTKDESAVAVLTGIYALLSKPGGSFTASSSITQYCGLSSDELTLYAGFTGAEQVFFRYYMNELINNSTERAGSETWSPLYNYIYKCNAAIEGLSATENLTPTVKAQLLGEAKFLRAFFYFYLVNLFSDVPLAISTDYQVNTLLFRSSKDSVYRQIINDLDEAQNLLSSNFPDKSLQGTTVERIRPTKWVAAALLSRVYLYTGEYAKAEMESTEVLNSGFFSLASLDSVFLKNNTEAIWQIQPTDAGFNTWDGFNFILLPNGPETGNEKSVHLSSQQMSAFEENDQRRMQGKWVDSIIVGGITYHFASKYKKGEYDPAIVSTNEMTEYLVMFRLAEQYLIRAEARAHLGNMEGAQADLNVIRTRAGMPNTAANDQSSLVDAILHERQVELFTEMGHRWFDLKRTGNVDAVMSEVTPLKGGTWQTTDQLYPLPYSELQKAPNLEQNNGY